MIVGLIPARSGSKSVKDKNIKPLKGRPLMAWSIKAGLGCKAINKVVVTTDSQRYAEIAKKHEAEVILRPKDLAQDETSMVPVLQHAVKEIEKQGDKVKLVVLLDPTSPLRQVKDIEACLEKIKLPNTDSVVTVCEAEHNPYYVMGSLEKDYFKFPLFKADKKLGRRQDAPKVYRVNAAVYAIKRNVLMKGKIFTDKTRVVIMPQNRSSHIDSQDDFKYTEFLLKEEK